MCMVPGYLGQAPSEPPLGKVEDAASRATAISLDNTRVQNPEDHDDSSLALPQTEAAASDQLSLDDAALDLVLAATDEGDDAVMRSLLRATVALGLTSVATFWTETTSAAGEALWTQRRGFGGSTPPPASTGTGGPFRTLPFGPHGSIVVARETFDGDGRREQREEALESLVVLAETLVDGLGEIPASGPMDPRAADEIGGALPQRPEDGENRRHAG